MKNNFIIQKSSYNTAVSIPLKYYIDHTDTVFCNIFMGHEIREKKFSDFPSEKWKALFIVILMLAG